jgi:hypothetical protein
VLASAQTQCKLLQAAAAEHAANLSSQAAVAAAATVQEVQLEDARRRLASAAAEASGVGTLLRGAAADLYAASQEAAELRIAIADSVPRASVEFERQVPRVLPQPVPT